MLVRLYLVCTYTECNGADDHVHQWLCEKCQGWFGSGYLGELHNVPDLCSSMCVFVLSEVPQGWSLDRLWGYCLHHCHAPPWQFLNANQLPNVEQHPREKTRLRESTIDIEGTRSITEQLAQRPMFPWFSVAQIVWEVYPLNLLTIFLSYNLTYHIFFRLWVYLSAFKF